MPTLHALFAWHTTKSAPSSLSSTAKRTGNVRLVGPKHSYLRADAPSGAHDAQLWQQKAHALCCKATYEVVTLAKFLPTAPAGKAQQCGLIALLIALSTIHRISAVTADVDEGARVRAEKTLERISRVSRCLQAADIAHLKYPAAVARSLSPPKEEAMGALTLTTLAALQKLSVMLVDKWQGVGVVQITDKGLNGCIGCAHISIMPAHSES